MCGIVGYTGEADATRILVDGLLRLEYRGYDSAGICVAGADGSLQTVKSAGKVTRLLPLTTGVHGRCGIAHTRWATHGAPSEVNAHPHLDGTGTVAVVHNGIIENYRELKASLLQEGVKFRSETDSEVIAHLIARYYEGDLVRAVVRTIGRLRGAYGIAVISRHHPGEIVCARNGSPVVVGLGKQGNMVASDVTALAAYAGEVIYLRDGEIADIMPDRVEVRNSVNIPVVPDVTEIPAETVHSGKGEYAHYMLKEIFEQPDAAANTLRGRLDRELGTALLSGLNMTPAAMAQVQQVVIAGCGSSMHAGMVGEYYFEDIAGIPTSVEQAAEFRYRNPIIAPNTLVIPISQSGETADTLAAVREAVNKGATVAAISNVVGSTIARECGRGVYLHAGPEISVASTKAFLCQVITLLMLALAFGRNRRMNREQGAELVRELESVPDLVRAVLDQSDVIRRIAEKFSAREHAFYIGRGPLYPAALEGALKLKEISYVHAEGYHAAELKHGPIALLGENVPVVALANDIPGKEKMFSNIEECLARHAPVIAVVTGDDRTAERYTEDIIRVPPCSRFIAPVVTVAALQLFAYYLASARNCPIDQPRNLAKSVTVE